MMLVKCFGGRRCGNHLLQAILDENWGNTLDPYQGEYQHHAYAPRYAKETVDAWDAVAITVKKPAPWLASILTWEDDGPGNRKRWRAHLDRWVKTYANYLEHFGRPGEREDVLWAVYEDYVDAPLDTALYWGEQLSGVERAESEVWLPAKHCSPVDRGQDGGFSLDYYREEQWRDALPGGAVKAVRQWFSHDTCRGVFEAVYPDRELA